MTTDIVVIGVGAAGLTAGLVLARARHRVTLVDDRTYRNATVDEVHGFPTRDATAPNRFRADAVRELASYGVTFAGATVTSVQATESRGRVELDDGTVVDAAAMLLATGVQDELPALELLADRRNQAGVRVGDHEAHPGETTVAKAAEELGPEHLGLGVADVDTEHLATPIDSQPRGDHHEMGLTQPGEACRP